jgi:hypothetical protein
VGSRSPEPKHLSRQWDCDHRDQWRLVYQTYAGFENESQLLWDLQAGIKARKKPFAPALTLHSVGQEE